MATIDPTRGGFLIATQGAVGASSEMAGVVGSGSSPHLTGPNALAPASERPLDSVPGVRLHQVLPRSRHDLESVDAYLRASPEERRVLPAPSLSRLRQVRNRLAERVAEGAEAIAVRNHYLRMIDVLLEEPSSDWIFENLQGIARLSTEAIKVFWDLSPLGRIGAYEVARALSERRRKNIVHFLANHTIETFPGITINGILETAALLADLRVRGFHRAFLPKEFRDGFADDKFLADTSLKDRVRIPSLFAEYRETLRIAAHLAVVEAAHDEELAMDWSRLTPEEDRIVRRRIEPDLKFAFRTQKNASVDILFRTERGRRRIVEVKTSLHYLDFPERHPEAELLQVFRHALLARIHGLEGVEYVLQAPRVSERLPRKICEVLELTGTSYVLTIRRGRGKEDEVKEWGMKRLGGDFSVPTKRRYPFLV